MNNLKKEVLWAKSDPDLLRRHMNLCIKNVINNHNIINACCNGNLNRIKYLIGCGEDIFENYNNLISIAAERGHLNIVKYLINENINIIIGNLNAIKLAIIKNHFDIVKYIVNNNSNTNIKYDESLIVAASIGNHEITKFFIFIGANIQANNNLALCESSMNGHFDIVKLLISLGATLSGNNYLAFVNSMLNEHFYITEYFISIFNYSNCNISNIMFKSLLNFYKNNYKNDYIDKFNETLIKFGNYLFTNKNYDAIHKLLQYKPNLFDNDFYYIINKIGKNRELFYKRIFEPKFENVLIIFGN